MQDLQFSGTVRLSFGCKTGGSLTFWILTVTVAVSVFPLTSFTMTFRVSDLVVS